MARLRCFWHVLLGAGLPWLSPVCNIGGVFLFVSYEYLQFKHLSNHRIRDDSYKDVYEVIIPYIISSIVRKVVL